MTAVLAFPADTWGMHDGVGAGWGIVMIVGMLLFWGAIVVGIAWLIRAGARGWPTRGERIEARETPVEVLERRFAEGAISVDDFRARREVLAGAAAPPTGASEADPTPGARGGETSRR